VVDDSLGHIQALPPRQPPFQAQVRVIPVSEKILIKKPYFFQHLPSIQGCATAGEEDFLRSLVLPPIDLQPSPASIQSRPVDEVAHVIDDIRAPLE